MVRMNYNKIENPIEISILISAITLIICQILHFIIAIPLFNGFGWKVFNVAGTSPQLKSKNI